MSNNTIINTINILRKFVLENLRYVLIVFGITLLIFISYQIYNYFLIQDLKKTSINFFNSFEADEDIIENLKTIKNSDNFFSILTTLKLIQNKNNKNKFDDSVDLYKELLNSNEINNLYKSSISSHAAYSLINASYIINDDRYFDEISFFIGNINDNYKNFFSIKKELQYLLIVTDIDINKLNYKNDKEVFKMYDDISQSNLILSEIKERVKKIHEFHLYN